MRRSVGDAARAAVPGGPAGGVLRGGGRGQEPRASPARAWRCARDADDAPAPWSSLPAGARRPRRRALVPWEDLTEADCALRARHALRTRRAATRPLPDADRRAGARTRAERRRARRLRHLAEARRELGDLPGAARRAREVGRGRGARGLGRGRALGRRPGPDGRSRSAPQPARSRPGARRKRVARRRAGAMGRRPPRGGRSDGAAAGAGRALPEGRPRARGLDPRPREGGTLDEADEALAKAARAWLPRGSSCLRSTSSPTTTTHDAPSRCSTRPLDGSDSWSPRPAEGLRRARRRGQPGRARVLARHPRATLRPAGAPAPRHVLPGPGPRRRRRRPAAPGRAPLRDGPRPAGLGCSSRACTARSTRCPRRSARASPRRRRERADEQTDDLAALARLALRAGGRPARPGAPTTTSRTAGSRASTALPASGPAASRSCSPARTGRRPWRGSSRSPCRTAPSPRRAPCSDELPRRAPVPRRAAGAARGDHGAARASAATGGTALALLPLVESGPPELADEGRRDGAPRAAPGRGAARARSCGSTARASRRWPPTARGRNGPRPRPPL